MRASFLVAWRYLARGGAVPILLCATALLHWLLPGLVRTDGSAEAVRELTIYLSLAAVYALLLIVSLVSAASLTASERDAKRFAIARTRPVCMASVMAGKWCAPMLAAGLALAVSAIWLLHGVAHENSRYMLRPGHGDLYAMAESEIDAYLAAPSTPEALKTMDRKRVLSHMVARELERKKVLAPGETVKWNFDALAQRKVPCTLQIRVANEYGLKTDFRGKVKFGGECVQFTNTTSRIIEVALPAAAGGEVEFTNESPVAIYYSPYRDVALLVDGGTFAANLLRTCVQIWATIGVVTALGLFMGAAVSRNVAVFAGVAMIVASLAAPQIVEAQNDLAKARLPDRIALGMTRLVAAATSQVMAPAPVDDLASRLRQEDGVLERQVAVDIAVICPILLLLAASIARRRDLP
ncbi:MAG: hypothetical protein IJ802_04885 [Kiritimatiellae bacterium]|nr:hypothetical protein [Kiritimatiellia bacterium]